MKRSLLPQIEGCLIDDQGRDGEGAEEVAALIVFELRAKIEAETGLTASAGIACNRRLAKVGIETLDFCEYFLGLKAVIVPRWLPT